MIWNDMIWMNDSLNYWTGLHQPNCAELLRTLPHTYCWPMGLDVRWVKVAGGCQLWRGALVDAWISWDWIWKKQCHIPPMTGNGLYPTYLWWFVGMVVIIVLPTVNFYGWSPIWKPINQRLFHERYFEWLNGWEGSRSDRGRLGIPICLLRLGCPSPLEQGP